MDAVPCGVRCSFFALQLYGDSELSLSDIKAALPVARDKTVSLLDIKELLGSRGIQSHGRAGSLEELLDLEKTAIITRRTDGADHFVVLLGRDSDGTIRLSDPPDLTSASFSELKGTVQPIYLVIDGFQNRHKKELGTHSQIDMFDEIASKLGPLDPIESIVDLGVLHTPLKDDLAADFSLRNNTNETISVTGTKTTCGCSELKISRHVVPPGGLINATMVLNKSSAAKLGKQNYEAFVYAEGGDTDEPIIVTLRATATFVPAVPLSAYEVNFGNVRLSGEPHSRTVRVRGSGEGYRLTSADSSSSALSLSVEENSLEITIHPRIAGLGRFLEVLTVKTSQGEMSLPVRADIEGTFRIVPNPLIIYDGNTEPLSFFVRPNAPLPLETLRVSFEGLPAALLVNEIDDTENITDFKRFSLSIKPGHSLPIGGKYYMRVKDEQGEIQDIVSLAILPRREHVSAPDSGNRDKIDTSRQAPVSPSRKLPTLQIWSGKILDAFDQTEINSLAIAPPHEGKMTLLLGAENRGDKPVRLGVEIHVEYAGSFGETVIPHIFLLQPGEQTTLECPFSLIRARGNSAFKISFRRMDGFQLYRKGGFAFLPPSAPLVAGWAFDFKIGLDGELSQTGLKIKTSPGQF
jgi:hypothetical protein